LAGRACDAGVSPALKSRHELPQAGRLHHNNGKGDTMHHAFRATARWPGKSAAFRAAIVLAALVLAAMAAAGRDKTATGASKEPGPAASGQTWEAVIQKRLLNLPVKNGAAKRHLTLSADGRVVEQFDIELADGRPDFWVGLDVAAWHGKRLVVAAAGTAPPGLAAVRQGDALEGAEDLYQEKLRPQFHFSAQRGWLNDPNGLVYYKGDYHLFFQHNPFGIQWDNMTWGHAVSQDLVHWQQWADAIKPDRLGTIFSGSAVVDRNGTSGFQSGADSTIVCIYTSAGNPFAQSLAYSNDRGRTWAKYAHNPVLPHVAGSNRDPKVVWHAPSKTWIMALYLDGDHYGLFASPDLKRWTHLHDVTLGQECPDFFAMALDGHPQASTRQDLRWLLTAADGRYLVGRFDGCKFTPEAGPLSSPFGYAVQTYSDIPPEDGRRIQIGWLRGGKYPGMPFNQQMTFPCELTLRKTPEGPRLWRMPVKEIELLRAKTHAWSDVPLRPGENPLAAMKHDLYDIEAEIAPGGAREVGFCIFGTEVKLPASDGRIKLRMLVDRTSIEWFLNDGQESHAFCYLPAVGSKPLELCAKGGEARIVTLMVYELRSAWPSPAGGPAR
jgi:sucrose-6-phosphate hydrolase SacC (GH32 family)